MSVPDCTGCGLGKGQVALVHAKHSLAPLSTEKHLCFGTISFRSSPGPPLAQMPPRCLPNVSQFPPSPGCVQDSLSPGAQTKKIFWLFCDLKKWPPKVQPKVSKWSPQMAKIRSKMDNMLALEPVLKKWWKNDEKPCLWILKNSGFAL